ncbi:MAG: NDP-sugar synthase [Acidobacteriota bacterium]|nr:NDP-sugar synthase [Blastocatellia bacterium]MDW8413093.1 NDP-sugar synthase [Acidobacteriota bacterium]
MQALILAGGPGTRLRPLTLDIPKPIVPIANRPFLWYQLEILKQVGVTDVTLSLSYKPEQIVTIFGDGAGTGLSIRYTIEEKPLGTAGAFKFAEDRITSTAIVFNGDVLTNIDLSPVVEFHKLYRAVATLVLVPVDNPSAYGLVETDAEARVLRFIEKPSPEQVTCNTVNAGIYILEPGVLKYIPEAEYYMFEHELFPLLLAESMPVYGYVFDGYWIDIGTNRRYLQANLDVINGLVPPFGSRDGCLVDENAVVQAGAQVLNSVIGRGCVIGKDALIKNSVLQEGVEVGNAAVIEDSVLATATVVGEASRVRRCVLGRASRISEHSIVGEV